MIVVLLVVGAFLAGASSVAVLARAAAPSLVDVAVGNLVLTTEQRAACMERNGRAEDALALYRQVVLLESGASRESLARAADAWTLSFPIDAIVLRTIQRRSGGEGDRLNEARARAALGTLLEAGGETSAAADELAKAGALLGGSTNKTERARTLGKLVRGSAASRLDSSGLGSCSGLQTSLAR